MIIDREAWQRVLEFDIENVRSEYGFATRLAKENFWTKDFTQRAIMEYRKFMFLAANADLMVSPSPVVDASERAPSQRTFGPETSWRGASCRRKRSPVGARRRMQRIGAEDDLDEVADRWSLARRRLCVACLRR